MEQKTALEKEKKGLEDLAAEKEKARDRKLKTIGNYVHESVPVSDNEVPELLPSRNNTTDKPPRTIIKFSRHGLLRGSRLKRRIACPTTKS